jgi:hypothetical protein
VEKSVPLLSAIAGYQGIFLSRKDVHGLSYEVTSPDAQFGQKVTADRTQSLPTRLFARPEYLDALATGPTEA